MFVGSGSGSINSLRPPLNRSKMSKNVDGQKMRDLAAIIGREIPGIGFAVLVFDFNEPGIGNYVSNAQREDMIISLKETVKRLEGGRTFPTPENA